MLAIIEVLEAGNVKATVALNKAGAGEPLAHVTRALFTRLHFLVARCYGKTRRKDRHARKAFESQSTLKLLETCIALPT